MTGILPVRNYAHQSAVSDFFEITMLDPGVYAPYVGFTEAEVVTLADEGGLDCAQMRHWYGGYTLRYVGWGEDGRRMPITVDAYSPYSVTQPSRKRQS